MFNSTFKQLTMAALILLPAAAQAVAEPPNLYELTGANNLHVTYSTTGLDGKPHFTYQAGTRLLNFSGNQIRTVKTEIGTLVSVTVAMTVDAGSMAFSILVPNVNLGATKQAAIKTEGILTQHKFSVVPSFNLGQVDNYTFYSLTGKARFVLF